MTADRTDAAIAKAVAALPYRRPRADFKARVMAAIAAEAEAATWREKALRAVGLTVGTWSAAVACGAAAFVYYNFADIAITVIRPGGVSGALNMLAARCALMLAKLISVVSFVIELAGLAMPASYEIVAASLICAAAITALSRGRLAGQSI